MRGGTACEFVELAEPCYVVVCACHEHGAGRGAGCCYVEFCEAEGRWSGSGRGGGSGIGLVKGERVNVGGLDLGAVAAAVAETEVVGDDDEEVWALDLWHF